MEIRWHWSPFTLGKGAQGKRRVQQCGRVKEGKNPTVCRRTPPKSPPPFSRGCCPPRPCCVGHKQGQWMPQEPPALGGEAKPL